MIEYQIRNGSVLLWSGSSRSPRDAYGKMYAAHPEYRSMTTHLTSHEVPHVTVDREIDHTGRVIRLSTPIRVF